MNTRYLYKTEAPGPVAIVEEYYSHKDELLAALDVLGQHFGGKVAPMRDISSNFAGGVKLSGSQDLDVHWRRPDEHGHRGLRVAAKLTKGSSKEERAAVQAEHRRLVDLWKEHCPPRLSSLEYWKRLNVNTGNVMWSGGINFALNDVAYFELGFQIDEATHAENIAADKPTSGWIEGAIEITASEYQAARSSKLGERKVVNG